MTVNRLRNLLFCAEAEENCSPFFVSVLVILALAFLAYIDYATGPEVSFAVFYMAPVLLVAWYTNFKLALLVSVASAAVWQSAEYLSGERHAAMWVYFWNPGTQLTFYLVIALLITRLKRELEKSADAAHIDHLTGLSNHRHFLEKAQTLVSLHNRCGSTISAAFIDLDKFKAVNDTKGHHAGDQVLQLVAQEITKCIRRTDVCGRLGGDEFALLLPETTNAGAITLMAKLRQTMHEVLPAHGWPVTLSVGVVSYMGHVELERLLKLSDAQIYEAKQKGGDCVCSVDISSLQRHSL